MRVIYVLFSRGWGGLERYTVDQAVAMAAKGHDVYFLRRKGSKTAEALDSLSFPGEEWNPVDYVDIRAMLAIRSLVGRMRVDILHAHNSIDLGITATALWRAPKTRLVFSNYMNIPKPKHDLYHRLEYGRVARVIVGSETMRINAVENLPIPQERVVTIHYGLDLEKFDPHKTPRGRFRDKFGLDGGRPVIGVIGRLDPLKGQMEMIKAMPLILRRFPSAILALTGDETPELQGAYKSKLVDKTNALKLGDSVIFTGAMENTASVLADLDIYVLASHSESFSLGCLEAMAMRRPVIGTDSGGTPQMLDHGDCGLLAEPKNPASFARRVIKLLSDRELAESIATNARKKVVTSFDRKISMDRLDSIYRGED